jgi:hypothetical protein
MCGGRRTDDVAPPFTKNCPASLYRKSRPSGYARKKTNQCELMETGMNQFVPGGPYAAGKVEQAPPTVVWPQGHDFTRLTPSERVPNIARGVGLC